MAPKKILVCFGATGNQGGSLIKAVLADPVTKECFQLRAVTRNPSSAAAIAVAEQGIEVVKGDLGDKGSLTAALKDAYAVFAVTNWQEILNKDTEIQYGKNVADAAKENNIQHFIWSSLPGVTQTTNGKISGVLHFDSKAIVEDYIRSLGIPATFFLPAVFMNFIPLMIRPASPGSKSYKLVIPIPGTTKVPYISIASDAGKYIKAILLNRSATLGKQVLAAEGEYTGVETAQIMREKTGLDIEFEQASEEDYRAVLGSIGFPDWLQDDMCQTFQYFSEFGYFGGQDFIKVQEILTEPLETFEEWVANSVELAALK